MWIEKCRSQVWTKSHTLNSPIAHVVGTVFSIRHGMAYAFVWPVRSIHSTENHRNSMLSSISIQHWVCSIRNSVRMSNKIREKPHYVGFCCLFSVQCSDLFAVAREWVVVAAINFRIIVGWNVVFFIPSLSVYLSFSNVFQKKNKTKHRWNER